MTQLEELQCENLYEGPPQTRFLPILQDEKFVDVATLRELSSTSEGVPRGVRGVCWRYFLGCLHPDNKVYKKRREANRVLFAKEVQEKFYPVVGEYEIFTQKREQIIAQRKAMNNNENVSEEMNEIQTLISEDGKKSNTFSSVNLDETPNRENNTEHAGNNVSDRKERKERKEKEKKNENENENMKENEKESEIRTENNTDEEKSRNGELSHNIECEETQSQANNSNKENNNENYNNNTINNDNNNNSNIKDDNENNNENNNNNGLERVKKTVQLSPNDIVYIAKYKNLHETKELSLYKQIDLDVVRTHPNGYERLFTSERLLNTLRKILFLWSVNHPETAYFQGLNELPVPFLVVFLESTLKGNLSVSKVEGIPEQHYNDIEADVYFCLTTLIDRITMAKDKMILEDRIFSEFLVEKFSLYMAMKDLPLWRHFQREGISTIHSSFRWFTCLFLRDMSVRCAVLLWDHIVSACAEDNREAVQEVILSIAAAILQKYSTQLLTMPVEGIMQFLQYTLPEKWNENTCKELLKHASVVRQESTVRAESSSELTQSELVHHKSDIPFTDLMWFP